MALPSGFLDDLRSRVSLADVVGRKVTWDRRKSQPGKGDMWAPCPFHQEKTASFHVDDRQGYYYCFGCHAKGDAITFLRESEAMPFMEAVEELARMAGMEMPARDPQAAQRAQKRAGLTDVMEQAVQYFRLQLDTAAGAEARAYLQGRGLSREDVARHGIGYAPPGWEGLREALVTKGASVEALLACGLVRASDKGRAPYDAFRNRIMFPIRDVRGRAIAFGGRALDPQEKAKYINTSDTELFDKGRVLYNHGPARAACAKGAPLIVAEGYMDVIALDRAGFAGGVAPLGTAITEPQLAALWAIHPEPIVALDGDRAGLAAGHRLMDLALPLIEAGQSLRFALLPAGQDPDDLLRAGGPEAVQVALDAAVPMVDLMWARATEGRVFDSPERRAALDRELRQSVARIKDGSIRSHYGHALRERRAAFFGLKTKSAYGASPSTPVGARPGPRPAWRPGGRFAPPEVPMPATRAARRAAADSEPDHLREAVILATLVAHPALIEDYAHLLEETEFTGPGHADLAAALLRCDVLATPAELREALTRDVGAGALERLTRPRHVQLSPGLRRAGDADAARACLASEFARLDASRGAAREVAEAIDLLSRTVFVPEAPEPVEGFAEPAEAYRPGPPQARLDRGAGEEWPDDVQGPRAARPPGDGPETEDEPESDDDPEAREEDDAPDDAITWRLAEAARARAAADRVGGAESADYDVAENGARIDRAEKGAFDALLRSIDRKDGAALTARKNGHETDDEE